MSKFTPGPWVIGSHHCTIYSDASNHDGQLILIAKAMGLDESQSYPSMEHAQSNARLIAAAPELLDALEALLKESVAMSKHVCEDCQIPYEPCASEENADKAIKKARGE